VFSGKDFIYKNEIALGECAETLYWLELLRYTDYLTRKEYASISTDGTDL
jgi:four helix bundle protein